MYKFLLLVIALIVVASPSLAATPYYNLSQPPDNSVNWGTDVNGNFGAIDTALHGLEIGKLNLTGGTLTGGLTGTTINATTLQQGGTGVSALFVDVAGDTMTGALTMGANILASGARDIGQTGTRFTNGYFTNLYGTTIYEGASTLGSIYLTQATAASTYLTIANAASTYLTLTGGVKVDGTNAMTGNLTITKNDPKVILNRASGQTGQFNAVEFQNNTSVLSSLRHDINNNYVGLYNASGVRKAYYDLGGNDRLVSEGSFLAVGSISSASSVSGTSVSATAGNVTASGNISTSSGTVSGAAISGGTGGFSGDVAIGNDGTGALTIQNTSTPSSVTLLTLLGPNSPSSLERRIDFAFSSAGSAYITAYRGTSWDTYLNFYTNPQGAGTNNPQLRMSISEAGLVNVNQALTVGGNTVWHAGNDGTTSGLDADLLDGQHGSYYAPAASLGNYLPLTGGTLTNTYSCVAGDNSYTTYGPNTSWSGKLIVGATSDKSTTNQCEVISTDGDLHLTSAPSKSVYVNYYQQAASIRMFGGLFQYNNNNVWHAGNDGSGSGLDADVLDNMNADVNANANTIVARDIAGNIKAQTIYMTYPADNVAASAYLYETGDGILKRKLLANVKSELVNTTTVNAALSGQATAAYSINLTTTSTAPITCSATSLKCTNLDADKLDGIDSTGFATSSHNHDTTYINSSVADTISQSASTTTLSVLNGKTGNVTSHALYAVNTGNDTWGMGNFAVHAQSTTGSYGVGVYALGTYQGIAGIGSGSSGVGVYGNCSSASNTGKAVYASNASTNGYSLYADGTKSYISQLGVGTTTPGAYALNVSGNANISGDIVVSGNITGSYSGRLVYGTELYSPLGHAYGNNKIHWENDTNGASGLSSISNPISSLIKIENDTDWITENTNYWTYAPIASFTHKLSTSLQATTGVSLVFSDYTKRILGYKISADIFAVMAKSANDSTSKLTFSTGKNDSIAYTRVCGELCLDYSSSLTDPLGNSSSITTINTNVSGNLEITPSGGNTIVEGNMDVSGTVDANAFTINGNPMSINGNFTTWTLIPGSPGSRYTTSNGITWVYLDMATSPFGTLPSGTRPYAQIRYTVHTSVNGMQYVTIGTDGVISISAGWISSNAFISFPGGN